LKRERRIFYRVGGRGVGPVIAYDGGSWAKGLRGEGVEKAGKEWGAVAGSDKGDDGWGVLHKSMMEVFRLGGSLIEEKSGTGQGEGVSGEKTIRVALDATAIGRGKTGNETYLRGLLEGWGQVRPEGIELTPMVSEPPFAKASEDMSKGGHAQFKQIAKSGFFKRHLCDLPRARAELKADLYHGVYWMRPWEKGPYVLTVHDISFAVHPEWFRPGEAMFYTRMVRRAAERARKVITVSEFCRAEMMERWDLPADQVEATYEAARKVYRPAKKKVSGPPTLLFVSAIHPRKNLGRLIRVWERLRAGRFPDLRLRVVGPAGWLAGGDLGELKRAVAKGGAIWEGVKTEEELRQAYCESTMLVYPSLYEGFGLPPLEAMACGCPVVCAKAGSLPEVCGGAAEYFDPRSEEEMMSVVGLVLGSEERREGLRKAGIARAAEFSWERMAEETGEIYRRVV
jgi:glycosyltransferase involved in cell wall biosynthesis